MVRLNELAAVEASRMMAAGRITSEALVEACLEKIRGREKIVGAWEYLDPDRALEQARALDGLPRRGPLHGIPVGVKDIMDTADMPTAYGSGIYRDNHPSWDASCVTMIRAAGGLVLGKTVTTEFAVFHPGKTTNPHNLAHTPGGSSSGSAAAVADFMVPLALGTQTGGSIIRPASFCGVVGYKPTFGLINRAGVKPCAESLDTVGLFARTIEDAAFFASVLTGRPSLVRRETLETAPRIGLCHTHEWPYAAPETIRAFEEAGNRLARSGAEVREVNLPEPFAHLVEAQTAIMLYEMARAFAYEYTNHRDQLSSKFQELVESGQAYSPEEYDKALALATKCRGLLNDVFSNLDVLLVPSAVGEAPEGLSSTGDPIFNRIWTLLHVPCVNIPASTGPKGLPVGLQIVGRIGDDAHTLAASDWAFKQLKEQLN
jgi:Asp-tRNA(Asn)/Glu-tRNA(Gln) amidotransferase A subunit family amidase